MGFGTGFSRGLDRAQQGQQLRLQQQKLQAEQRNALSQEIDTRLTETAKQMQAAAKEMAAVIYSSPPEKQAEIIKQYEQSIGPIGASALQLFREGSRAGIKSQGDYENAKQILTIAAKLPDLKAAETVKAGGVGAEAQAKVGPAVEEARLKQPLELEQIAERGRQARMTAAVPRRQVIDQTTQQIQQMTEAGSEVESPALGKQVMDDIRESVGQIAAISKGASRVGGEYVPGTNPRLDAEQRVNNFNQEIKFAFSRNPRFPVAEIERIQSELLPDPKAIFADPEAEARKIPILKQHLFDLNKADQRALQYMSEKGKEEEVPEAVKATDEEIGW